MSKDPRKNITDTKEDSKLAEKGLELTEEDLRALFGPGYDDFRASPGPKTTVNDASAKNSSPLPSIKSNTFTQ